MCVASRCPLLRWSITHTYETTRDLLTGIAYHRGSTLVVQCTYGYDTLGRPTVRNTARQGSVVNDTFTHNTRAEFNAKGQLTKQYQDTGWNTEETAATLYEYDSFGNVSKQTLALSSTPTKDMLLMFF
ncbi:MAG: hypothetical protein IKL98_02450 [Akkermansia sp.]|nr:hypothetical protein [Akkermansia sp.]